MMGFWVFVLLCIQTLCWFTLREENEQLRRRLGRLEGNFDRHLMSLEKKSRD
jgi:hypothetical protein